MILDATAVPAMLKEARVVAVLGAHTDAFRPAHYVPEALFAAGLRVLPVNTRLAGNQLFGRTILGSLAEIDERIDILDVFRRAEDLPAHLPEILAMSHRPRVVWFQSGIRNDDVARALSDEGIDVVQDRCLMVDYRRWGR
jgi:predicted CoA-binding protein